MRHSHCVDYSYEPDVIHDVFGHQAALLIPEVHKIHHKCGLAAVVSTHEEKELLAAIFWFTFEVGLAWDERDPSKRRLIGGSLLSGINDAQRAMDSRTPVRPIGNLSKLRYKDIQFSGV